MSNLGPAAYDAAEREGRKGLSNRVIEAFHPETFAATGYPVHVSDDAELWRYVDVMHETRLEQTVTNVLCGLSQEEFLLFRRAVAFMVEFTRDVFGKPLHCENALLRAMNIYRYIRTQSPKVVLELGPGSGYLGLLLILSGIGYIAFENTQAFYLLQNRLWKAAAGDRFLDLADDTRSLREILAQDLAGRAVHVPWWKVMDLEPETLPASVTLMTANHCLTEMQTNAMRYYLKLGSVLLRKSAGPFIFEGWGSEINHPRGEVGRTFVEAGFALCHADDSVTAFVSAPAAGDTYGALPLSVSALHRTRNLFRKLAGMPPLPYGFMINAFAGANAVSNAIRKNESELTTSGAVGYREIAGYLAEAYANTDENPEERFLALIGSRYL